MSCPRYRDSVVLLMDGELSDDAAHGVQSHLAGCEGCRAFAAELSKFAALLTPASKDVTHDETRFWRKFDADLAVRVARGETPWWKRTVSIPMPAMGALALVLIVTGGVAGRQHAQASHMEMRARLLQAMLHEAQQSTVFPASVTRMPRELSPEEAAVRNVEFQQEVAVASPAPTVAATVNFVPGAPRPAPAPKTMMRMKAPGSSIHFVDSEGVLQPGDLY